MDLFIVIGDDRYYEHGEIWIVGLFTSEEKAQEAVEQDKKDLGKESHYLVMKLTPDERLIGFTIL